MWPNTRSVSDKNGTGSLVRQPTKGSADYSVYIPTHKISFPFIKLYLAATTLSVKVKTHKSARD